MKTWQLQDAKSRFSEVVKNAQGGEAQIVTKHGKEVVVVLDYARFLELTAGGQSVLESLRGGPDLSALELERDRSPIPTVDLE